MLLMETISKVVLMWIGGRVGLEDGESEDEGEIGIISRKNMGVSECGDRREIRSDCDVADRDFLK